ncbi:IS3 family transposase (plasmid) [Ensifer adhaerens]|nr:MULTISPECIES: IS3 family transposase [Ensifer]MBD9498555.1 IS3 family transposase [Ensifer sp. ENS01]MBD9572653.1 IS3 family transposase [Ensifer sp. ENS08]UTV40565.1 IS3 family transposase [Ensifer adhaerens]WDZ76613.1 IS3 family transposase [Ensifer adhaerens]WDZ79288.1 IS3 family transposase [Ensifer adhaerens]
MSNEFRQVDLMIGDVRRRRWTTERKLQIIEESYAPGETVSSAARRHGVAPNLLYRWRRLLSEGGAVAVDSDEPVIGNSEVKKLEDRVRELERILGRKTLENEILREALSKAQFKKTDIAADIVAEGRFPMKAVAEALHVSRSNLSERLKGKSKPRGPYLKADDAELLPAIRKLVDARPTYGYRRIAALLNRQRRAADQPVVNRKRVHRIMANHAMILEKHTAVRKGRVHDGKVMVMRSNLRWCSDGLEFTCWNGEVVRLAFIIDAFDREIISWAAVANAGISGSDVRDMMLEAVEKRFGGTRAPHAIEHLSDNGSAYTARETRLFAQALNLVPCFTPVASPQSNGMSEAFVKTLKRDYIRISPIPDADTALRNIDGWIEDYNEIHPHSALKMASPREFIKALSQ